MQLRDIWLVVGTLMAGCAGLFVYRVYGLMRDYFAKIASFPTALNNLDASVKVPVDAVTASGSGLDPDISVANADLQAPRVASARKVPASTVMALIAKHTDSPQLGFLGEKTVNVLDLNLALDRLPA